jgi:hypothetical protein
MAKRQAARGESVSGYFRKILAERPDLLRKRKNTVLFELWLRDHPGHKKVPLNVRQGLSNVKSVLRKKGRKRGKKGRLSRGALAVTNGVAPKIIRIPATVLVKLEVQIDACLTLARTTDADGLGDVIRELRSARNAVVWKQGK